MSWLLLVLSLPTENASARMRAWRTLKASGAAVLRDGAYLLPDREHCRATLRAVSDEVVGAGGSAYVLEATGDDTANFAALFDRSELYAELLAGIAACRNGLTPEGAMEAAKQVRRLRKSCAALTDIDFFPGPAREQTDAALLELETTINRILSPDEPRPADISLRLLDPADYRGRRWATRQRPWVDRLASAWLIRRCIDPEARFLWLASPADLPDDALGFDFDGAAFTHVGNKVTFETLLASFAIDQPALNKIAALVHYLDVGGVQPAEAAGVERILAGLRGSITDDDRLLQAAGEIFDGLLAAYAQDDNARSTRRES
ncbi:MAG TPA: chromate resistance protein ChrB domain-containing protein [Gammaproteobacteria bacterium]